MYKVLVIGGQDLYKLLIVNIFVFLFIFFVCLLFIYQLDFFIAPETLFTQIHMVQSQFFIFSHMYNAFLLNI